MRVALISASPLVLAGLEDGLAEFEIALSSSSLAAARDAQFGHADVAIVDAGDDTDELRGEGPPLLLLVRDEQARLAEHLGEGISVLPAGAPVASIAAAARAAAQGLVAATPELLSNALRFEPARTEADIEALTAREREVLAQLAQGLANREIAEALHISMHTAKFHVGQIIAKLAAKSRAHAVAKAMHAGIV